MNSLFALFVLVALVVCASAQYYYGASPSYYNSYAHTYPYGYAAPSVYNYGAYNPALSYLWKK